MMVPVQRRAAKSASPRLLGPNFSCSGRSVGGGAADTRR
jgi:hypothetical protein